MKKIIYKCLNCQGEIDNTYYKPYLGSRSNEKFFCCWDCYQKYLEYRNFTQTRILKIKKIKNGLRG